MDPGGVWKATLAAAAGLTVMVVVACVYVEWVLSLAVTVWLPAVVESLHPVKLATPAVTVPPAHVVAPVMAMVPVDPVPLVTWLP